LNDREVFYQPIDKYQWKCTTEHDKFLQAQVLRSMLVRCGSRNWLSLCTMQFNCHM
jgi:hypothetical protein